MEKLTTMKLLRNASETITVSDFRRSPGDVFSQAQMGKTFTITRGGKIVAHLIPPEPNALELGAELRRREKGGKQ